MTAKIKLNAASGGGSISIQAPSSSSNNRVISLPDIADGTLVTSQSTLDATKLSGDLPAISGANLTGISAGITMMDQWRIINDNNKTDGYTIDSSWERSDTYFAQLGSGMTESSGLFTFPVTGVFLIFGQAQMNSTASYAGIQLQVSTNGGSNFSTFTYGYQNPDGYSHVLVHGILDVTETNNHRVRMVAKNQSSTQYSGDTNAFRTGFTFIRLGDT